MLRTGVPEAAIDKDGNALTREGDINADGAPTRRSDRIVAPEAEPNAMEGRAEAELRPGVPLSIPLHHSGHCSRGRMRIAGRLAVRARRSLIDDTWC